MKVDKGFLGYVEETRERLILYAGDYINLSIAFGSLQYIVELTLFRVILA